MVAKISKEITGFSKTVFGFILAGQCITKGTFNPPSYNSPLKPFKG